MQTFPKRVAAIDVGSNAIRFLGAELLHPERYAVLEQIRTPVRLGHEVFQSGCLDAAVMDAAVATLVSYRERIDALAIVHYRAVATSAVRESANGDAFIARVHDEAGIVLEPITGAEEARLVHQAVRNRIELGGSRWLLVDLGGGSVEISVADQARVRWSVSHPIGAVRLLEELAVEGDDLGRFRRRVETAIAPLRVPAPGGLCGFIATGGNSEALARLTDARQDERGVSRMSLASVRAVIETLSAMPIAQRVERLGLREDRADVILPAAVVYERLCARAGFDTILVPHVGVRDGLVLDLADELAQHTTHARRQDELVWAAAHALGRRYRFDRA
ncbi:MAG: Ppx/GppA family phosphatase, partial [Longimicrobiales bacterium]